MTQNEMVYDFMSERGSITDIEAFSELGVRRLSARIFDLRHMGHIITALPETVKSRYGNKIRVARYVLGGGQNER